MPEHSEQRSSTPDPRPVTRHTVGFYEGRETLVSTVVPFLAPAVEAGAPVIALLDAHDAPQIEGALGMTPLHIREAPEAGGFAVIDAPALLRQIQRAGPAGMDRFERMMEALIGRVTRAHAQVRLVAQMARHDVGADMRVALAVEDVWDRLAERFDLAVLCAYPLDDFDADEHAAALEHLCDRHSIVTLIDLDQVEPGVPAQRR